MSSRDSPAWGRAARTEASFAGSDEAMPDVVAAAAKASKKKRVHGSRSPPPGPTTGAKGATSRKEEQPTASIVDVDVDVRASISDHLDVVQWDALRRSCKSLVEWPAPPPPSVAYHLVRFYLTDDRGRGRCGVAKTLGGVVDAYRHLLRTSDDWLWGFREAIAVDVQFLFVRDLGSPMLPLVRYGAGGGRRVEDGQAPARIHDYAVFGVRQAGEELPNDSAARDMMSTEVSLSRGGDGGTVTADRWGGLALRWLGGLRPARDLDLRNLCFLRDDMEREDGEDCEIWLFRDRHGRTVGNGFQIGPDGGWAVCD